MRVLIGFVGSIVIIFALAGCGATAPTAPAAAPVGPSGFGVIMEPSASTGTSFSACLSGSAVASCFSAPRIHAGNVAASAATAPGAPLNLVASSAGSSVTLTWSAPSSGDVVTTYIIEAGSFPGAANLANFSTGNTLTVFQASGIGAGTYYVRLRAANQFGTSVVASNEAILVVGGSPRVAPGAPTGLTNTVNSGGTVGFAWNAATGSPTTYVIEAGSQSGLANLANSDLGSAATTMTAAGVGAGTYYVRVRAKNAFGISGPSNEVIVTVVVAGSSFSGNWSGTYTVTSCNAGAAGGPIVGPIICGSALRAGTTLPITLSLSQNGTAVSGSVLFGSSGTSSLNGTIGATGALSASGTGTYSASGVSFRVLIGGFAATTDGTRLTATWGEFISQTGVSVLSGSADVRLRTVIVLRTP
jgi:hypothetical protein